MNALHRVDQIGAAEYEAMLFEHNRRRQPETQGDDDSAPLPTRDRVNRSFGKIQGTA